MGMAQESAPIHPHPPVRQETYRTVHEILEETARMIELSSRSLEALAADPQIDARDTMMLSMLAQTRAEAAKSLFRIVNSAERHGEGTWVQYAPVFGNRSGLTERIAAARCGQDAYAVVSEVDREVETALHNLAEGPPASRELLQQTEAVVLQLQRSGRTVVESAQDI